MQQKGQIILLLILVMTVALSIGLSVVQKSLVDVSTASKVEQSSRAFSAAEAGVEKALQESSTTTHVAQSFVDNNSRISQIVDTGSIPLTPASGTLQAALEYPPLAKEEVAHFWLADFNSIPPVNPPPAFYTQTTLDIYWGNSTNDPAALELTLVYYDGTVYQSRKWYLDNASASRNPVNGFEQVTCGSGFIPSGSTTLYQCKKTLTGLPTRLMLIRARLLYNSTSQPLAIQAVGTCGKNCSLPLQQRKIISIGISGETERRVKIIQESKVVPFYFDYAIFSAGDLNK